MSDLVIQNVFVPRSMLSEPDTFCPSDTRDLLHGNLVIFAGRAVALTRETPQPAMTLDGHGRILLAPLADPHLHLDKTFTVERIAHVGGNLLASIREQESDKVNWTEADIRARAERALEELVSAGVSFARTHVDWDLSANPHEPPLAWSVLKEVAADWSDRIILQRACLPDIDAFADADAAARIAIRVARDEGVLGAWILHHAHRAEGIRAAFRMADQYGLALDFHVDEGQDRDLNGLSLVAGEALRTGFRGPVLCGHAVSLMNHSGAPLSRLLDDIASAGIGLCALPLTNLYVQSRGEGSPDRRGITRLQEASKAGIVTCLGADNVQDAFYPLGRYDPLLTLSVAVPAMHLDPPLGQHLRLISTDAARVMGFEPETIDRIPANRLLLAESDSLPNLLTRASPRTRLSTILSGHG